MNCYRNYPWYKGWQKSFQEQGFTAVGIHTPESPEERNPDAVHRRATEEGLTFPILVDNQKQNWNAWGNSMWPSTYLIDKQGYVRYWWYGEPNYQQQRAEKILRQWIAELLNE